MIDRFHHLFIAPADFDASLAFYRDVLGWTIIENWQTQGKARGVIFSSGGMKLVLAEREEPLAATDPGVGRPHLHLDIHDIDARFRVLPKGTHIVTEREETHWATR